MGQWLSVPMIAAGFAMMAWSYARAGKAHPTIHDRMK
jgi:prolipoprotein diacylglyceryltransferase